MVTGPSGGSDVTFNEVFMCSPLILIAIGALKAGLAGAVCFSSFQDLLCYLCFQESFL